MATFIEEVALRLYEKYGDELSSKILVLPSKRARLFFAEALSKIVTRPIWEPNYISIDDLMGELSGLRKADKLRLIAELFNVYTKHRKETFDEFYHWGEMLVSDFDMVDKYMVNASQLFTNISDLKEIESDLSYLEKDQVELINRFWGTLKYIKEDESSDKKNPKAEFFSVWQLLESIYNDFRAVLRDSNLGYTGMIYREAVEKLERGEASLSESDKYVFIGFNALSECEKRLLKHLQTRGQAEFYWDYDLYYQKNEYQEAGMFIRKNIEMFPCEEGITHDNFKNIASIDVISTSSNVAQCQVVADILEKIATESKDGKIDKDTAIVLTDENLLMPLLYAIPEKFKVAREEADGEVKEATSINVTMGLPLRNTLTYSFIERLFDLQKRADVNKAGEDIFYYADVDGLLAHPYLNDVNSEVYSKLRADIVKKRLFRVTRSQLSATPLLETIFRRVEDWQSLSKYLQEVLDHIAGAAYEGEEAAFRSEFLALAAESLIKLENIVEDCGIDVSVQVYRSLVRRHLQSEKVPFTGEPLSGLQIMGILETRNLDFKNVILLSMTDSNFPGSRATDKSFLPYSLRFGFNIPTAEHHEGVYAYYFYRLIQRAQKLYMIYSSAADDKSTGEPSRYIRQIEYETDFKINFKNVGVKVAVSDNQPIVGEKSDEVYEKLLRYTRDKELSPTAFSTYVKCPFSFYLKYLEGLYVEDELEEDVDNLIFGNIFHEAADKLYKQMLRDTDPKRRLEELLESGEVERCLDNAIGKVYFSDKTGLHHELSGELHIVRNMVLQFLKENLFEYDKAHPDFSVMNTEYVLNMGVPIEANGEKLKVKFEGRADRVDSLNNGLLRVIDYKTGKMELSMENLDDIFDNEDKNSNKSNIINTLLYAMMLRKMEGRDVRPELYYIGYMKAPDFDPMLTGDGTLLGSDKKLACYSQIADKFEEKVTQKLTEMFDRETPFKQREGEKGCKYCDFLSICNKKISDWSD